MLFVYRFFYAPYQILRRCGIKGPTPVPFFGNYRQISKMVIEAITDLRMIYSAIILMYMYNRQPLPSMSIYLMSTDQSVGTIWDNSLEF